MVRVQGIPCITVSGIANVSHAWNEVYVNDRWINIDATFDSNCRYVEEGIYFDGPASHRYFDVTDEEFAANHKVTAYPAGNRSHLIVREISAYGEENKGGDVEVPLYVFEGSAVTLTAKPETGYQLAKLQVLDKYGKELPLHPVSGSSNQFQFTMPTDNVWIKAQFVLESDTNAKPKIESTKQFQDISASDYFFEPVQWAASQGITSGTSSAAFSPSQTCTKAEIITFIWRSAGSPESQTVNPFRDVTAQDYLYKPALWAYENSIVRGSSFAPYTPCTRAMAVEFLWKQGHPRAATRANFSDVDMRAEYTLALGWALEKGITRGTSSTTFSPNQTCTRAQIVTFLYRSKTN